MAWVFFLQTYFLRWSNKFWAPCLFSCTYNAFNILPHELEGFNRLKKKMRFPLLFFLPQHGKVLFCCSARALLHHLYRSKWGTKENSMVKLKCIFVSHKCPSYLTVMVLSSICTLLYQKYSFLAELQMRCSLK